MGLPLIMYETLMTMNAGDTGPDLPSSRSSLIFRLHPSHLKTALETLGRPDDMNERIFRVGILCVLKRVCPELRMFF